MALYTLKQRYAALGKLGFRGSHMISNFQRGWALGTPLTTDNLYGPKTDAALKKSISQLAKGYGTASPHFSFTEFRCKCGGYAGCQGVWMLAAHLRRLEAARTRTGPIHIVSGCRCPQYNRSIGGASQSQHLFGAATDVLFPDKDIVRSWKLFAGLGRSRSTDRVLHVDSRDLGGHNLTGGRPSAPTIWDYA